MGNGKPALAKDVLTDKSSLVCGYVSPREPRYGPMGFLWPHDSFVLRIFMEECPGKPWFLPWNSMKYMGFYGFTIMFLQVFPRCPTQKWGGWRWPSCPRWAWGRSAGSSHCWSSVGCSLSSRGALKGYTMPWWAPNSRLVGGLVAILGYHHSRTSPYVS